MDIMEQNILDRVLVELTELKVDIRYCRDTIVKLEAQNGDVQDLKQRVMMLERAKERLIGWLVGGVLASGGASAAMMKLFTQ